MKQRAIGPRSSNRSKPWGQTELLVIDGLEVRVTRKPIKHLHLRVKAPYGTIETSAPRKMSNALIADFVREKRQWIENRRREIVNSPSTLAEGADAATIESWRHAIQTAVPPLMASWAKILGVKPGRVTYRNMKTRWGSCQPTTGRITINIRLALYPPECLEYVVVHELCHLLERGHGPRFKALMDATLPDWQKRRALLR